MRPTASLLACLLVCSAASSSMSATPDVPRPPVAPKKAHTVVRHGETVTDDYFWLREKTNPEVTRYLEAENAYTASMTASLAPFRDALYAEMLGRIKQTDVDVPERRGAFLYYARTVEGKQYPVRCRRPAAGEATEQVVLDMNEMARGKAFFALGAYEPGDDGTLLAFTTDETGYRQYALHVKDLRAGYRLPETAERVTSVAWAGPRTLVYSTEDPVTKRSDRVWRRTLGAPLPVAVYEEKDPLFSVSVTRSKDGAFVFLESQSTDTSEVRYVRAADPEAAPVVVLARAKGHRYGVEHREGLFYIRTNREAKNFRVLTAPVATPGPEHWATFVAHDPDALVEDVHPFRHAVVVVDKKEGLRRLRVFDPEKGTWHVVSFPEEAYALSPGANPEYDTLQFRFVYESPVTPKSVYDYDLGARTRTLLKKQEILGGYDASRYEVHRLWAPAQDGARVPVSIVFRKGVPRDGSAPLWLYGYGSYGFGMQAAFAPARISLLDRGVVFAIAHIRGGDEMGERWHDDGMLMNKRHTFTDFIDTAEFLVREKWAAKDRVLIEGASAGGLLMGAVTNMRPDLFRAVLAKVPFVDVMNTMSDDTLPLTVVEYLEWGNPNEKPAYDYMKSYCPYTNIGPREYPAMLVVTSLNDSQVMYWEPAKYVAKLRAVKTGDRPLLLRTNMAAGHGGASGRYDALRDTAFEMSWMLSRVGITK